MRFILIFILASSSVDLMGMDFEKFRNLDKASMALTGQPLDKETINKFASGELTEDEVIDQLTSSDAFVDHMARYWTGLMGVQSMQNITNLLREGTNSKVSRLLNVFDNYNLDRDADNIPRDDPSAQQESRRRAIERIEARVNAVRNRQGSIRMIFTSCQGEVFIFSAFLNGGARNDANSIVNQGRYTNGNPTSLPKISSFPGLSGAALYNARLAKAKSVHQAALDLNAQVAPGCDASQYVPVVPSWDKSGKIKYRATKYLVNNNRCGSDLSGCFSDITRFPYLNGVGTDSTLEPGRIIAKTIADDLNFKSILTTSNTVMTGRMAHFLTKKLPQREWDNNFPGGKYPETKAEYVNADYEDDKMFWVNRGTAHSGVLTTYAYQMVTNGRRAKANRAFEVFTCSKFIVPDGAVPDPNDDNPDLRQRKYCAYCHRTLEPMAAFFNRWPATGRVNYEYNESEDVDDRGLFRGKSSTGIRGFGKLLSDSDSFDSCSVRRAFEFVYGRALTKSEASVYIPKYLQIYKHNDSNLRTVIKEMVKAREFLQTQEEEAQ